MIFHTLGNSNENLYLVSYIFEEAKHTVIGTRKVNTMPFEPLIFTKLSNMNQKAAKVGTRDSREQMVENLKMKPTVKPIKPLWALNIYG
ncbi:hypothetical protein L0F63_006987, partial [Massospora cicadina]